MASSFTKEEWDKLIEGIKSTHAESLEAIQHLARSVDAIRLFVATFTLMSFGPPEGVSEITHGNAPVKIELLAYYLFPFFGVSTDKNITPWHTQACMKSLDKLLVSRTQERTFTFSDRRGKLSPADGIGESIRSYTELVRGSAYPEQTSEEIISIQGKYTEHFERTIGLTPQKAVELLWEVVKTEGKKLSGSMDKVRQNAQSFEDRWLEAKKKPSRERTAEDERILTIFKSKKVATYYGLEASLDEIAPDLVPISPNDLDSKPSEREWNALISLIGLTSETRKGMADPIEVRQRPLFVLPDNRILLGDISNALDALYGAFERVARMDKEFYDKRYQRTKAKWLEERVFKDLSQLLPAKSIFKKLHYPDPDKDDGSTAELDIAVRWSPFLILIENKAKQFRIEAQLGDVVRLRTDIKANIEDAFEQARRAVRYIESGEAEFVEHDTGRKVIFRKQDIQRINLLTVSQHHLAGIANRLTTVESLGLFRDKEYPLSVCAADLDIITEFCPGPDVFLHYIERRLEVQRSSIEIMADEIDYFGAYLETRLQPERLWGRDEKVDGVWLSGFSETFDNWIKYKRGELETAPRIVLNVPTEIGEFLSELRTRDEDQSRWIAFALLGLSDGCLRAIAQMVREVREAKLTPGMFRRVTHKEGETVISVVASLDLPPSMLRKSTMVRTSIEKYRRKALRSIGFGIMVADSSRPFHCALWMEGPWKYDERIEEALASEPDFVPVDWAKLPGRNAPCVCGSGKKFKKCCLRKIEAAYSKGVK